MDTGNSFRMLKGSDLCKVRRRALKLKSRTLAACIECKKSKRKCTDHRPCPRCMKLGKAHACREDDDESMMDSEQLVHRPIRYGVVSISFENEQPYPEMMTAYDCFSQNLKAVWSLGFEVRHFKALFDSVPYDTAFAISKLQSQLMQRMRLMPPKAPDTPMQIYDESVNLELLASMWEADDVNGFLQITFDPVTSTRTSIILNSRYAQLHGYHREELIARYCAREAPFHMADLDCLANMADDWRRCMERPAEPDERFLRVIR
eukprot:CAMPEP_0113673744 /NCGR_PEP_ID=MMETSP0038_2-20120614/7025_1 /TAXON_ID=2898 /ORGANISM="Cryptomonas paramecium" /LENGTH=261 /DNA_ID=CAMNT_0000590231 /DNA_START=48 /DNA_END=830 /DNA_ORIENTATION=+ /assembly_acc=CAM_ASM_000170